MLLGERAAPVLGLAVRKGGSSSGGPPVLRGEGWMKAAGVILAAGAMLAGCAATPGMRERSELVAEPDACAPKRFDIYFADGEAGLTEAARTAIGLSATQLQGCRIRNVNVIGLTDSRGGP